MRVAAQFERDRIVGIEALDDEAAELLADETLCELALEVANRALERGSVARDELEDPGEDSALVAIVLEAAHELHT